MTRGKLLLLAVMAVVMTLTLGCPPPEPEPECSTDDDCEVGKVCEEGACTEIPCPDIYEPVCGEDGKTYANDCDARVAHVAIAHPGECERICGGIQGLPCPEGETCDLPAGECEVADAQGVCVETPEACDEIFEPVCGCDGVTYSNDCFRLMAGAQKDHDGECGL